MNIRPLLLTLLLTLGFTSFAPTGMASGGSASAQGDDWRVTTTSSGKKQLTVTTETGGFTMELEKFATTTQVSAPSYLAAHADFSGVTFPFSYSQDDVAYESTMTARWHTDLAKCNYNPMSGRTDNISGYRDIDGIAFAYTTYSSTSRSTSFTFQYSAVINDVCYQFIALKKGYKTEPLDDVLDGILFTTSSASALTVGQIVTCKNSPKVYEVISKNELRWFKNEAVFLGSGHTWKEIKTVACKNLDNYTISTANFPTYDTLVKFKGRPEVYASAVRCTNGAIVCSDVLTHIQNETKARSLYGTQWQKKIVELPAVYKKYFGIRSYNLN